MAVITTRGPRCARVSPQPARMDSPTPRPGGSSGWTQPTTGPGPPADGGVTQPDMSGPSSGGPAHQQDRPERDEGHRHDQAAERRAGHVHAAEQGEQAAEPELPAPPATARRTDRRDEQERDAEAERAEAVDVDAGRVEDARARRAP